MGISHVIIEAKKDTEETGSVDFSKEKLVSAITPAKPDIFAIETHQGTLSQLIESLQKKLDNLTNEEVFECESFEERQRVELEGHKERQLERAKKTREVEVLLAGYKRAAEAIENPMQAEAEKPKRRSRKPKPTIPAPDEIIPETQTEE